MKKCGRQIGGDDHLCLVTVCKCMYVVCTYAYPYVLQAKKKEENKILPPFFLYLYSR